MNDSDDDDLDQAAGFRAPRPPTKKKKSQKKKAKKNTPKNAGLDDLPEPAGEFADNDADTDADAHTNVQNDEQTKAPTARKRGRPPGTHRKLIPENETKEEAQVRRKKYPSYQRKLDAPSLSDTAEERAKKVQKYVEATKTSGEVKNEELERGEDGESASSSSAQASVLKFEEVLPNKDHPEKPGIVTSSAMEGAAKDGKGDDFDLETKDPTWWTFYQDLLKYKLRAYNRPNAAGLFIRPAKDSSTSEGLSTWAKEQRMMYKSFNDTIPEHPTNKLGKTVRAKINLLKKIGFVWEIKADPPPEAGAEWVDMFWKLRDYVSSRADTAVPTCTELGMWCLTQRIKRKSGGLTSEQIAALDMLGFTWDQPPEADWSTMFVRLTSYFNQHKDCLVPPPDKFDDYDDPHRLLRLWSQRQRTEYELYHSTNQRHKKTPSLLTEDQIAAMDSLGFVWAKNITLKWIKNYRWLKSFHEEHGHTRVSANWPGDIRKLGKFCVYMRLNHRAMKQGKNHNLNDEKLRLLNALEFEWELDLPPMYGWEKRYEWLKEFREEHGHCLVPQTHPTLGDFVKRMRRQYHFRSVGQPNRLNDEKVRLLDELGFTWRIRERPPRGSTGKHPVDYSRGRKKQTSEEMEQNERVQEEEDGRMESDEDPLNAELDEDEGVAGAGGIYEEEEEEAAMPPAPPAKKAKRSDGGAGDRNDIVGSAPPKKGRGGRKKNALPTRSSGGQRQQSLETTPMDRQDHGAAPVGMEDASPQGQSPAGAGGVPPVLPPQPFGTMGGGGGAGGAAVADDEYESHHHRAARGDDPVATALAAEGVGAWRGHEQQLDAGPSASSAAPSHLYPGQQSAAAARLQPAGAPFDASALLGTQPRGASGSAIAAAAHRHQAIVAAAASGGSHLDGLGPAAAAAAGIQQSNVGTNPLGNKLGGGVVGTAQEMKCRICANIMVKSTGCIPCGHTFCGICVLEHIVGPMGGRICPICGIVVTDTVWQRHLDSMILYAVETTTTGQGGPDGEHFTDGEVELFWRRRAAQQQHHVGGGGRFQEGGAML